MSSSHSRSRSPLASQRSRWSGAHHRQASYRSTLSTASSRWMLQWPSPLTRRERCAPVPPPSSSRSCWSHPGPSTSSVPSRSHLPSPVPSHSRPPSSLPVLSSLPTSARSPSLQLPFPRSPGYVTTDSEDDHAHGYVTPFPKGHTLRIINRRGQLRCPICPGRANLQWNRGGAKNHVLRVARSSNADEKKRSCHRALARNEGCLPPLSSAATKEEESGEDDDDWI